MIRQTAMIMFVAIVVGWPVTVRADPSTPQDRAALFDYILKTTLQRTAFSPFKTRAIRAEGYADMADYVRDRMLTLRDEMIAADTDERLFYVLQKINAVRCDSHLKVDLVEEGIQVPNAEGGRGNPITKKSLHAPIKFKPDYSEPGECTLFVSDFATNTKKFGNKAAPKVGDLLVSVNGEPVGDYLPRLAAYFGKSSNESLWWDLAMAVPQKCENVDPVLYAGDQVEFQLKRRNGKLYILRLPYMTYEKIRWTGTDDRYVGMFASAYLKAVPSSRFAADKPTAAKLPEFELTYRCPVFDLYLNRDRRVLYLRWHMFAMDGREQVQWLVDYAGKNDLLDYAIIFDLTRADGGTYAVWMLQRFYSQPFKMTFGNLRISDITPSLTSSLREWAVGNIDRVGRHPEPIPPRDIMEVDNGQYLVDWIDNHITPAVEAGREYTNSVPFKAYYLPPLSDGVVYPAETHFTGPLVLFTSPHGYSHVDQFAAMFVDNEMGLSVGMPTGSGSNTWEWTENLVFPLSGKPVVRYKWTAGQTIRPNGEALEGNAPQPNILVPLTRDNHLDYYNILLGHAYRYIDEKR